MQPAKLLMIKGPQRSRRKFCSCSMRLHKTSQSPQRRRGGRKGREGLHLCVGIWQRREVLGQLQRRWVHDVSLHAQRQLGLGERSDPVVFGAVLFLHCLNLQDRHALKFPACFLGIIPYFPSCIKDNRFIAQILSFKGFLRKCAKRKLGSQEIHLSNPRSSGSKRYAERKIITTDLHGRCTDQGYRVHLTFEFRLTLHIFSLVYNQTQKNFTSFLKSAHRDKRIQSDGCWHRCPRARGQPGAKLEGCPTHHGENFETEGEPQSRGLVH